ncbi:extracellular solute-binding protein [Amycolatopsis arida]|uniref:Extracellular solute-binding protein n=1 Tax=Amycolatopsis arida TaxID=587909 RepID=A0A1I5ZPE5_9PSEU|nr:substrate-binding domain-containing protein [Amycolatopsis arida]TDX89251.1 extracellular solute-binding protein [Amycolatopsis arida]SFQ58275.1 extracellular solute-binding protein [Amycolatopsis arida]
MGRHSKVDRPAPPRPDGRTSTGSHRAVGRTPRRRIAAWPIVCTVLVALLGMGWLGLSWADGVLASRAEAQASSCQEGDATLRVVVTPSAEQPVTAAAARWNEARTVVRAHCVHVEVEAMPSRRVLDALAGATNLDAIGGMPAGWLPESSWWISELTQNRPEMIASPAESVTSARGADYPFLGLSGEGIDVVQKHAMQSFRAFLLEPTQQADFAAAGIG